MTASTLVIFIALAATCFMFGWVAQRQLGNRREADLQRTVYEAKGAVPQLESALRNRDGRINVLQIEAQQQGWNYQSAIWRARRDSNARPLASEANTLSS